MPPSVDDRLAILDLAARYNQAFDYGDVEAWVATFTSDGVFATATGFTARGIEELRAFAEEAKGTAISYRHWNSSHTIEVEGDTATHTCYLMVLSLEEAPKIWAVGRYDDELRKVNGDWRFRRRLLTWEGRS
jgi:ketosteroid isomerase-like protein